MIRLRVLKLSCLSRKYAFEFTGDHFDAVADSRNGTRNEVCHSLCKLSLGLLQIKLVLEYLTGAEFFNKTALYSVSRDNFFLKIKFHHAVFHDTGVQ